MRTLIVGLGIQGKKRLRIAGTDAVGVVDTVHPEANFKNIKDVPLNSYDAVCLCTPDQAKIELITWLLQNKKHVMVEKPLLSKSQKDLEVLFDLATKNQVTCYTAYNHRFEPHIVSLKKVLDSGILGNIYCANFFYGNGTARDVRNSVWRDKEMGVMSDLGSHLLDMYLYLFDNKKIELYLDKAYNFENKAWDHVVIGAKGEQFINFEMTLLSWKNSFYLDVRGESGSAHLDNLCKWGPSHMSVRTRVLPSGRPPEKNDVLEMADPTWEAEYTYFKKLCETSSTNLANDLWINEKLNQLFAQKK